jgi:hypothetical protein
MDSPTDQSWYLRKHEDGTVFGPLEFEQLQRWASSAQIAPHDKLSTDQETWIKAPMLPQLEMDWLVEVTTERYYGPTTIGAIEEFIRLGEISDETFLLNSCNGTRHRIADFPELLSGPNEKHFSTTDVIGPAASGMLIGMQDRIRDLEQTLAEERRALRDTEERYRELESMYRELVEERAAREATL